MAFIHIDIGPPVWILATTVLCIVALRGVDAWARATARRRTRQVVDRALEAEDPSQ